MDLQTSRLRLEPLEPRHADPLFHGLQDERLYEMIPDKPPASVAALRERYAQLARRQSPDGSEHWLNWAVWLPAEGRYIGYVQATVKVDQPRARVAYVLFSDAWGKGFAREAVRRMMEHLGEAYDVAELRASVDVRNQRSIRLLESLGFVRVAVREDEAEYLKH
jgi:ribosomal-protein-alanine N-acetyltransferase